MTVFLVRCFLPPCLRAESSLGVEDRSVHLSSVFKRVQMELEKLLLPGFSFAEF